jgi:uncharacterized membrane protein
MRRPYAFWIELRSSLWFVPTMVVLVSMGVGHGLVEAGLHIERLSQDNLPALFGFSAEGSRAMLSAIATSMATIAGVAFSITVVTLSLASSQYSPRVLHQFMRDRANQWVLGIFVGAFAYCLTVLPQVRGGEEDGFIPALAVAFGVLYALAGVGCVIFFIHHTATSIQVSCIVSDIAAETRAVANQLFPDGIDATQQPAVAPDTGTWHPIPAVSPGYIQLVEEEDLLRIATKHDRIIRMEHGVGEFIVNDTPLASVSGEPPNPALANAIRNAVTLSRTRTVEQDVMFGVRQIVDVALRALSPSVNDPTTATLCVNYLTTILHQVAERTMGDRFRRHQGTLRLVVREPSFATLVGAAFREVRSCAASHVMVIKSMLQGLDALLQVTTVPRRRALLVTEVKALRDLVGNSSDPTANEVRAKADDIIARAA